MSDKGTHIESIIPVVQLLAFEPYQSLRLGERRCLVLSPIHRSRRVLIVVSPAAMAIGTHLQSIALTQARLL